MNVDEIRRHFPILSQGLSEGRKITYLDNAATTHKPLEVIMRIREVYENRYANVHRSGHYLARQASMIFENVRDIVKKFINAERPEEIVFVWNTTHGINVLATPLLELVKKNGKDEVLISVMEHHSNMLPWRRASSLLGLKVKYIPVRRDGTLDYDRLGELISKNTGVIAVTHASNVTGVINDLKLINNLAKEYEAYVVVDGAQYAPHSKVDVRGLDIDFYVFSGHKMLAPEGTGVLYGKFDLLKKMVPFFQGGGAIVDVTLSEVKFQEPPFAFEAGTPNIAGVAGLGEAINFLQKIGMEEIVNHERNLLRRVLDKARDLNDIIVYGPAEPQKTTGIFSFNMGSLNPHIVGTILDNDYGIAVRTGLHCAHPYHYALGAKDGTVRASFYLYNTLEEADYLVESLKEIEKKISIK